MVHEGERAPSGAVADVQPAVAGCAYRSVSLRQAQTNRRCRRAISLRQMGQRLRRRLQRRHMQQCPQGTTATCTGRLMHTLQSTIASGPSAMGPHRAGLCGSSSSAAAAAASCTASAAAGAAAPAAAPTGSGAAGSAAAGGAAAGSAAAASDAAAASPAASADAAAASAPGVAACSASSPSPAAGSPAAAAAAAAPAPAAAAAGAPAARPRRWMACVTRRSTSSTSTSSSPSAGRHAEIEASLSRAVWTQSYPGQRRHRPARTLHACWPGALRRCSAQLDKTSPRTARRAEASLTRGVC